MAVILKQTMTADGNLYVTLENTRGNRNIYTVHLAGGFGGGTATVFTNPEGPVAAAAATTYDVAINDASGTAVSATANKAFDFECNSDPRYPTMFKLILTGSTNPTLHVKVCNVK